LPLFCSHYFIDISQTLGVFDESNKAIFLVKFNISNIIFEHQFCDRKLVYRLIYSEICFAAKLSMQEAP